MLSDEGETFFLGALAMFSKDFGSFRLFHLTIRLSQIPCFMMKKSRILEEFYLTLDRILFPVKEFIGICYFHLQIEFKQIS